MFRRSKMSKSQSRRSFTKGAVYSHKKNTNSNPMRGGIRL